jgi:hypothetical protein
MSDYLVLLTPFLTEGGTKNHNWLNILSTAFPDSLKVGLFFALIFGFLFGGGLAGISGFDKPQP